MSPADSSAFNDEDLALLRAVERGNEWLRAVLCTLARRGVAFRRDSPERADQFLRALAPLPLYKGGQFLFDLLEWEDFMLDGPPPPLLSTTFDERALRRIATALESIRSYLDGDVAADGEASSELATAFIAPADEDLPPLEPGFYLYNDVVLGIVRSAAPLIAQAGDVPPGAPPSQPDPRP